MTPCAECGAELGPSRLACPRCGALRHRERLESLAAAARDAEGRSDRAGALGRWREALELLPPESGQHAKVRERITLLSREVDAGGDRPAAKPARWGALGALGAAGLLLWKAKAIVLFLLGKGKLLLLGLTKAGTLFSMAASLGVYWAAFGWPLALGLVASIYVHEMGHVVALARLGISASAPMFIPGLGAVVRLHQYPVEPREDARVGLAGPEWGLGAALAASAVYLASGRPIWAAIAALGAWINLFNLLPLGPLDGGRGFRALSRPQRLAATATVVSGALLSGDGIPWLVALVAGARALSPAAPESGDRRAAVVYCGLAAAFCLLLRWLPRLEVG